MPTDAWFKANPKISGYVPQTVYDRLIQFKDERGISISQAVTTVLSEYFGVDRGVDQSSFAGVTLAQVQELEQGLASLAEVVERRFQELEDKLGSTEEFNDLSVDHSKILTQPHSSLGSELISRFNNEANVAVPEIMEALEQNEESKPISSNSGLIDELLSEEVKVNTQVEYQNKNSVLLSKLPGKLLNKESGETLTRSEPFGEIVEIPGVQPLLSKELSQRLRAEQSLISRYKNGKRKQSLAEWSKTLDPEGVAWEFSEELKKYVPVPDQSNSVSSTSSLQIKLLNKDQDSILKSQVEPKIFGETLFTVEQLAARLGMSTWSISRHRTGKQVASFSEWTQGKDPDGIAWNYNPEIKMYHPSKLLSSSSSNLLNFDINTDSISSERTNE